MNTFNTNTKKFKVIQENSRKCKNCGHTMFLSNRDKVICSWCGYYVFKNEKIEFEFRMGKIK